MLLAEEWLDLRSEVTMKKVAIAKPGHGIRYIHSKLQPTVTRELIAVSLKQSPERTLADRFIDYSGLKRSCHQSLQRYHL